MESLWWWYSNKNILQYHEYVQNKQDSQNKHENKLKTSINQAYLQWLTHAGFQTGILIAKWCKIKKGEISMKSLQNPVNRDGQPYLTISYTSQGFYNIFRMRWITRERAYPAIQL